MIRIDLPAVWLDHLDCEPGEHRWITLPGEQPPGVLVEALAKCDPICRRPECRGVTEHACDRCVDGRPLVELVALCPTCEGDGWFMGHDISVHPDARVDADVEQVDCLDCDAYGYVSAGVWVADTPDPIGRPLPILPDYRGAHIAMWCNHAVFVEDRMWPIDLPSPADRVGEWAVRLRRVR